MKCDVRTKVIPFSWVSNAMLGLGLEHLGEFEMLCKEKNNTSRGVWNFVRTRVKPSGWV